MKGYEEACATHLPRRMPVIMRLDGKAFHSLTQDCARPFDRLFSDVMGTTALELCKEVQGTVLAYYQSDEISLLIHNYKTLTTQPWFDNNVQKMVSVSAAAASVEFTKLWGPPALFDSRIFVLPEAEVCNYFIWRQQDAVRNSIIMLTRSMYSHKECDAKNGNEMQEMCFQKGQNWNNVLTRWKRGACVYKNAEGTWIEDQEIPTFTQDRNFIERHLAVENDD